MSYWGRLMLMGWLGGLYVVGARADILISEIHCDPDLKTEQVEFVELYNAGSQSVNLNGWCLCNAVEYTFDADDSLAAQSYLVVAAFSQQVRDKWSSLKSSQVYGPFTGKLANEGETLILRNAAGRIADEVSYGQGFPWPLVGDPEGSASDGQGPSMQWMGVGDNAQPWSWRSEVPTPGKVNSKAQQHQNEPRISEVSHDPTAPQSGQAVTITAKVSDEVGLSWVRLYYQVVQPGDYVALDDSVYNSRWLVVAMRDDGQQGDAVAADGLYSVVLPTSVQDHRVLVRYRVKVRNQQGVTLDVPYDDDPQPNFAYFVYDGVPGWKGAFRPGASGNDGKVMNFSAEVMQSVPVYHLIADDQDVQRCQYNGSYQNTRFYGTLVYDGRVYDHIQYRVRGEYSTYESGKNKWRFYFNRGHEFQARDNFRQEYVTRWRIMNFSAGAVPWVPVNRGLSGMGEALAFSLYRRAGVPAPYTHFLEFRVIDNAVEASTSSQYEGDLWGLYMAIEHPDGRFLDEHGLPDGNTYHMAATPDQKNQGPTQVTDQSDLTTFRNGYNQTHTLSWWQNNLELDHYYSFRAINRAVNNMDLRDGYNLYLYHHPDTDRWTAIPWDLDMLYLPVTHWSGVVNLQNCLRHDPLERDYQSRCRELQDLLLTDDQIGPLVDQLSSFINATGETYTLVDMDRAMWEYHPRTASDHRGMWFNSPVTHPDFNGQSIVRTLVSADFEGLMQWLKDFLTPWAESLSTWTGNGFAYDNGYDFLDSEAFDVSIPETPSISYLGGRDYPVNDLVFQCSDDQAAIQWRIAAVEPNLPWSAQSSPATMTLLAEQSDQWRYRLGTSEPSSSWRQVTFNDASWLQGQTSIGYGDGDDQTVISGMQNNYSSIYLRHEFEVDSWDGIGELALRVYVDDGCIVWINGQEVARLNVSAGSKAHDDLTGEDYVDNAYWSEVTYENPQDILVLGKNILAVHVLNSSLSSSDLSIDVGLYAHDSSDNDGGDLSDLPVVDLTRPLHMEIEAVWESQALTDDSHEITIPAGDLLPGQTYRVRCRLQDEMGRWSHWSTPHQFVAGDPLSSNLQESLRITEIMYNPPDADGDQGEFETESDDFEFIEFKNVGSTTLDLSGLSLTEGVRFDFSTGRVTSLTPDQILLVVRNEAAFMSRYGTAMESKIAGAYEGKLSNGGEQIQWTDFAEGILGALTYDDAWYDSTDGEGKSLELRQPKGTDQAVWSTAAGWRASSAYGGSPGQ